jgi:hypothetical protein
MNAPARPLRLVEPCSCSDQEGAARLRELVRELRQQLERLRAGYIPGFPIAAREGAGKRGSEASRQGSRRSTAGRQHGPGEQV